MKLAIERATVARWLPCSASFGRPMRGLARIRNDAAVDALIGGLDGIPAYGKLDVRLALSDVGNRTPDPRIKERITAALK